jgi:hypothetical protein
MPMPCVVHPSTLAWPSSPTLPLDLRLADRDSGMSSPGSFRVRFEEYRRPHVLERARRGEFSTHPPY